MLDVHGLRRRIYFGNDGMCQQDMFLVFFIDKGDILHKQAGNLIREPVGIGTTAAAIEKGISQLFSSFQLIFFVRMDYGVSVVVHVVPDLVGPAQIVHAVFEKMIMYDYYGRMIAAHGIGSVAPHTGPAEIPGDDFIQAAVSHHLGGNRKAITAVIGGKGIFHHVNIDIFRVPMVHPYIGSFRAGKRQGKEDCQD